MPVQLRHALESLRNRGLVLLRALWTTLTVACAPATPPQEPQEAPPGTDANASSLATQERAPTTSGRSTEQAEDETGAAATRVAPALGSPFSCASLTCWRFETPAQAMKWLVRSQNPKVVGFGEAHARRDFQGVPTVLRFRDQILPALADRSSHLVVELLAPAKKCEPQRQAVQKESDEVTATQAGTNRDDYLSLGHRARKEGVVPDILRASCDDLRAIAEAGDTSIAVMMETIARLSAQAAETRLEKGDSENRMVLLYGGALHNDVEPRQAFASWSYGPKLSKITEGRYLEVDLLIPQLIRDTDSWKKFSWHEAYRTLEDPSLPVLIRTSDDSFALVFPADNEASEQKSLDQPNGQEGQQGTEVDPSSTR